MYGFHGVSTKYLSNYMYWLKWLQIFSTEKEIVKCNSGKRNGKIAFIMAVTGTIP